LVLDNESTEIDMPEDDSEAMEIMVNNAVHDGLDASQILRVASSSRICHQGLVELCQYHR
jgi:hypothetical protein